MTNAEAVQEWLRTQRHLSELETKFTDLAIQAAAGKVKEDELEARHKVLLAARELCAAAYARAFPSRPFRSNSPNPS